MNTNETITDTIKTYVVVDEESYPVDTPEQIEAAEEALKAAGEASAPVYVGHPDCPDSYANGQILFAR